MCTGVPVIYVLCLIRLLRHPRNVFILHLFLKKLNAHQYCQIAIIQIKNNPLDIRAIGLDPAATS